MDLAPVNIIFDTKSSLYQIPTYADLLTSSYMCMNWTRGPSLSSISIFVFTIFVISTATDSYLTKINIDFYQGDKG